MASADDETCEEISESNRNADIHQPENPWKKRKIVLPETTSSAWMKYIIENNKNKRLLTSHWCIPGSFSPYSEKPSTLISTLGKRKSIFICARIRRSSNSWLTCYTTLLSWLLGWLTTNFTHSAAEGQFIPSYGNCWHWYYWFNTLENFDKQGWSGS